MVFSNLSNRSLALPDLVTSAPSVAVFRSRLKTHLFNISYPSPLWLYSACAVTFSCFRLFNRSCLLTYLCHVTARHNRVATNLENLEYTGISLNIENSGNSVQPQGKIVTNKVFFSLLFKYLCKTAVDLVNRIIRNRDEVRVRWWPVILLELMWNEPWWGSLLHLLIVAITYGKVSLWLWNSLENSGNFFSYFVTTLHNSADATKLIAFTVRHICWAK